MYIYISIISDAMTGLKKKNIRCNDNFKVTSEIEGWF